MTAIVPARNADYLFHVWTDGCAVFDRHTGDTHVLDVISAYVFLSDLPGGQASSMRLEMPETTPDEFAAALDDARCRLESVRLSPSPWA